MSEKFTNQKGSMSVLWGMTTENYVRFSRLVRTDNCFVKDPKTSIGRLMALHKGISCVPGSASQCFLSQGIYTCLLSSGSTCNKYWQSLKKMTQNVLHN